MEINIIFNGIILGSVFKFAPVRDTRTITKSTDYNIITYIVELHILK